MLTEQLAQLSSSLGASAAVIEALGARYDDIMESAKSRAIAVGNTVLRDFDWNSVVGGAAHVRGLRRAQIVMSSDKLSRLSEPRVQLSLDLVEGTGEARSELVEVSVSQLETMIASLQSALQVWSKAGCLHRDTDVAQASQNMVRS